MPEDINLIKKEAKKHENTHNFLSEEILVPWVNHCDGVRINMFDSHLLQALVLKEPDFPNVFTNFENMVGDLSTAYLKADRNWQMIKVIPKNQFNNLYILKDENNYIESVEIKEAERITERFGYKIFNNIADKKEGDIIEENEYLFNSTTYDENKNFCYGRNLRAVFLAFDNLTYEDSNVISESAANKMSSYLVDEIEISLNTNDMLINEKGTPQNYKCFPDIGEYLDNNILAVRRRMKYESILYEFNNKNIAKMNLDSDTVFFVPKNSLVYDIDVFCNAANEEKIREFPFYKQVFKYYDQNRAYYTEIINTLSPYINDSDYECSNDTKYLYRRALDMMDEHTVFTSDGNKFDNMMIKIRTIIENPVTVGSKLTGRYGSKGIVAKILPDDEMPIDQYGKPVDICLNPMGVIGRMNLAQCYEMEINFLAEECMRKVNTMKKLEDKFNYIMEFYQIANKSQYEWLVENIKTKKDKEEFIAEANEHGLYIHEPPFFNNTTMNQMIELYDKFLIEKFKFTINGKPIHKELIAGNLYYMRLKHDPMTKLSVRSSADINMYNVPSKSSSFKYHTALFSKTPVRIGEMERNSLLLTNNSELVDRYLAQMSANPDERKNLITHLLMDNPFKQNKISEINTTSITSLIVKTHLETIGLRIKK